MEAMVALAFVEKSLCQKGGLTEEMAARAEALRWLGLLG